MRYLSKILIVFILLLQTNCKTTNADAIHAKRKYVVNDIHSTCDLLIDNPIFKNQSTLEARKQYNQCLQFGFQEYSKNKRVSGVMSTLTTFAILYFGFFIGSFVDN